ncbi:fumarylacetoacetate hydrolase family protein [Paraburkholderia acidicola]|uniref:Fumarylacetoacetate hydrolase family protein n=1 Tax=Paraburkholderia acidicola TaxID=1912599 RepID=A0ABV1LMD1_9BURK
MAVSIIRYLDDAGALHWGRLVSQPPTGPNDIVKVIDLAIDGNSSTGELIAEFEWNSKAFERGQVKQIKAKSLQSPVTKDATLICQGLNYSDHAAEAGHHQRKQNLLFAKASASLSGPYDDILRPAGVELLDYEVEVGIVLRSKLGMGDVVDDSNIGSYVAGVVLCNDVSARDVMFAASFMQWYQGKSYRTFCPAGPVLYLMAPSEVAVTLENLEISLTYQGERRQHAITSQLIFKPAETLTQIASITDLGFGDMILTGTPGGVIAQGTPKLIETLKTHLLDDASRREGIRVEMKNLANFLQPGESVSLTMRDLHADVDLGGQHSVIAEE